MTPTQLFDDFLQNAVRKIDQDRRQIDRCASLLTEEQAWSRPNPHCNSVANQILHLTGNLRQWILGGLCGELVERDRPAEFAARGPAPIPPIVRAFDDAVDTVIRAISGLNVDELSRHYEIQGYSVTGLIAVFHVAEHVSFHTGQIVHITKALRDVDLSLYDSAGTSTTSSARRLW